MRRHHYRPIPRNAGFSNEPRLDALFAPSPKSPLDLLFFIILALGILLLALNLSACDSRRAVALPEWGNTPKQQQQPSSALFPEK